METSCLKIVGTLRFLVVCSVCKKGRVSHDYWQGLDAYLSSHSDVTVSHGYCPECYESEMAKLPGRGKAGEGGPA